MKKQKYYHATKARLKPGQRLSGSSSSIVGKNYQFSDGFIYMTTSPYVHCTIVHEASNQRWFVYEVQPIGELSRGIWDEWTSREVEVVKLIGRVGSIGTGLAKFTSASEKRKGKYITMLQEKYWNKENKEFRGRNRVMSK